MDNFKTKQAQEAVTKETRRRHKRIPKDAVVQRQGGGRGGMTIKMSKLSDIKGV